MVIDGFPLQPRRSFLGPLLPTLGDWQRLRELRRLAASLQWRIAALEARPTEPESGVELQRERTVLEVVKREIQEHEKLLALM